MTVTSTPARRPGQPQCLGDARLVQQVASKPLKEPGQLCGSPPSPQAACPWRSRKPRPARIKVLPSAGQAVTVTSTPARLACLSDQPLRTLTVVTTQARTQRGQQCLVRCIGRWCIRPRCNPVTLALVGLALRCAGGSVVDQAIQADQVGAMASRSDGRVRARPGQAPRLCASAARL